MASQRFAATLPIMPSHCWANTCRTKEENTYGSLPLIVGYTNWRRTILQEKR
jgi:hypothetical protein